MFNSVLLLKSMKKLYYDNPYIKECQGKILKVFPYEKRCFASVCNQTLFYGECGGQRGDRGLLDDIEVIDTRKGEQGESLIITRLPPEEGKTYTQKLDWPYRLEGMIAHTGQHLISGLLYKLYDIGTLSVHTSGSFVSIETDNSILSDETIFSLEDYLNLEIRKDHPVYMKTFTRKEAEKMKLRRSIKVDDNEIKIVEIEDCDIVACGGVHVSSTSQLIRINYAGQEKIRSHVRLFWNTGKGAVEEDRKNRQRVNYMSTCLSCTPSELQLSFNKNQEKIDELKRQKDKISNEYAASMIENNCIDNISAFENTSDILMEDFAGAVRDRGDTALCIVKKQESSLRWLIALKGTWEKIDFNFLRKELLPVIKGKGGGKSIIYQGIGKADGAEEFLQTFRTIVSGFQQP